MRRALETGVGLKTFAPQTFRDLAQFCAALAEATPATLPTLVAGLPPVLRQFLDAQQFSERLVEIRANVASEASFRRRVGRWFNAFRFLKFAQYAGRNAYPKVPVATAAGEFVGSEAPRTASDLLRWYRCQDRDS